MARRTKQKPVKTCRVCGGEAKYLDLCGMHYARIKRDSPNADRPGKVRDGTRTAKVIFSCPQNFKDFLQEKAGTGGVSEFCYGELKRALDWHPVPRRAGSRS